MRADHPPLEQREPSLQDECKVGSGINKPPSLRVPAGDRTTSNAHGGQHYASPACGQSLQSLEYIQSVGRHQNRHSRQSRRTPHLGGPRQGQQTNFGRGAQREGHPPSLFPLSPSGRGLLHEPVTVPVKLYGRSCSHAHHDRRREPALHRRERPRARAMWSPCGPPAVSLSR